MEQIDPITFEVLWNALLTAAAEMKVIVMRASYASLWRESGDLSCGILTKASELVAQGPADIPVHLATMPFSLKGALEKIPIDSLEQGDVLFHNDPEHGNGHLPDCFMAKPIFYNGDIIAFSAVRGHWADMGGMLPGSYAMTAGEIYQEGLRIPPVKIYEKGQLNREVLDLILANIRGKRERLGDLRAQYAGCITGERKVIALAKKFGANFILKCMEEIMAHSEKLTRVEIRKIPDGTYNFVTYADGDGIVDEPIRIEVTLTIYGDEAVADFSGSHPQTAGGMNSPLSVTTSAVQFAIKAATDPWNPANSGCYRPVKVVAPRGCVVNPILPAPIVAGNHETSNIIADAVFGALDQACKDSPERVIAAGCGSGVLSSFGGIDPRPERKGREYVCIELHGGSWGSRFNKDGVNATRVGVGNTGNQPVEAVEIEFPIMVEAYELVADAGGPGKFKGGIPLRRITRMLGDSTVSVCAERGRIAAFGLRGGKSGALGRYVLNPGTSEEKILFSKTPPLKIKKGEVILIQAAGGGGFGNPLERDPEMVRKDVINGYVSVDAAKREYGVEIDSETYQIVKINRPHLTNTGLS